MQNLLKLAVLGELRVMRAGTAVTLPPSKKTRALLAYLAVVSRPQRRERLCEMFWQNPDDPRGALRWSLSRIRQIIGGNADSCLRADRNTIFLDPAGFDCDFRTISSLAPQELERLGTADVEAIVDSFRGDFLEDLYLPHCPQFEAWRVAYADQAALLRLSALRLLLERTREDPQRALRHAHMLQALVPDEAKIAAELERLAEAARQNAVAGGPVPMLAESPPIAGDGGQNPRRRSMDQPVRRQVSVLAAEINSPLQSLQDDDPESSSTLIEPLIRIACREVERHGGTIIGSSDGSIVGLFGAETAIEHHALQACRAALALKAAAGSNDGQPHLCIGLDSGEAVLRQVELGDKIHIETQGVVVRTARQLAQSLRRDAIVCTGRMTEAIEGYVSVTAIADAERAEVVSGGACHELLQENTVVSRWHLRRARALTRMIGREKELQLLGEAARRARSGKGLCIGVVADAGIGKSRLIHEFLASEAASGIRVVEAGALESDGIASFQVVKKLLRAILQIDDADEPSVALEKARSHLALLGADASLQPPLLFVLDLPVDDGHWAALAPSERARRVRNAIVIVVTLLAKASAVAIVIEDLHWIDVESAAVLDRLIDGIATQPVLMLTTSRPENSQPWGQKSTFSQLRLEPLDRQKSESFLGAMLGEDCSTHALVAFIAERTDGVPLFIEETVQTLAQSGALLGAPGAYTAPETIGDLRIPPTIQSVIAARIDRLTPEERRLLQNAAVVGREVSIRILASIAGCDEASAAESAARLQSAGFLYEKHLFPVQVFVFKHALVQKVAYDSLLKADRRVLHARLIDAVEARLPHLIDDHTEMLSEHAILAERWDKAEHYLLASARRALQRSSHNLALSFLSKGLDILEKRPRTSDRDRKELEYKKLQGVAWMAAKGWGAEEVSAAYRRAEALCEELDDRTELFTALRGRAQYYMISGQPRAAQTLSHRCASMTELMGDSGIVIETNHMFWTNSLFMGACSDVERYAEQAIALYEPDRHHALTYRFSGHDPGVCSHCFSGLAAWQRGDIEAASRRCHAALELAQRFAHPLSTSIAYWGLAHLHILRREPGAALAWGEKIVALSDEYMLPLCQSQGAFQVGWASAQLGDVAGGIAMMERGIAGIRATGAEMGLPYLLSLLAETFADAGERGRALGLIEMAIGTAMRNGSHFMLSEMMRIKALVLSQASAADPHQIEALLRSALDVAEKQNASLPALRAATALAQLLEQHKRRSEARDLLAGYEGLIASLGGSHDGSRAAEIA